MSATRPSRLSVLVLTEDSGEHAHETIVALARKMLRLVEPTCQTQRVTFEPANDDARAATQGNLWKSKKPRTRRALVALRQTIATQVARPRGFVFFHIDGDQPWSRRHESENRARFPEQIVEPVRELLRTPDRRGRTLDHEQLDERLARLRLLMPFYSIESWLYQNTDVGVRLCRAHHRGNHAERFEHWRAHPHELDELEQPKRAICLADRHNLELARTAYPAEQACSAGTSFASCVADLRTCTELLAALREYEHPS